MLRMLNNREHRFSVDARERITQIMCSLDVVILSLPQDPSPILVGDLERIVTTLRTADESAAAGKATAAMQLLELAGARMERFRQAIEELRGI
jgi:hypothetical protein